MSTNYPTSLDTFTTPSGSSTLGGSTPKHTDLHTNEGDAIEALQAKVGVTGSAVTSSLDYRTNALENSTDTTSVIVLDSANAPTAGTAINSAISSLPSGGGTIIIPAGTWTINTAVLISKNGVVLRGSSNSGTVLQFNGASVSPAIKMTDTTQRFCQIDNMTIQSSSSGSGTAIDASYFVNSVFSNLRIGGTSVNPNKGIIFNVIGSYYNHVRDCRVSVSGSGSQCIAFDNTSNSNMVTNCRLSGDANTTGVYVNSHAIGINRVDCETSMSIGIDVATSGHDCTVTTPYLEAISTGIQLASGVESFTCLGGVIIDCTTANITDNGAKDPGFLNVRLQYEPYTSFTVRSAAFPSSYPIPSNTANPQDHGVVAWSIDPASASSSSTLTNGTQYFTSLYVRNAVTVTKLHFIVGTGATTPVAGQNFIGIYNSSGTKLASVGIDTEIAAAGWHEVTISSTALSPGIYWVGLVSNASVGAAIARAGGVSANGNNFNLTASTYRFFVNGTSKTALDASITPASNSVTGSIAFFAATEQ